MSNKLFVVSAVLAVVCLPLAYSLTCYTCTTPSDCKSPRKTTCSNAAANETSYHLNVYHQNVRQASSSRFDCMALKYTHANNNTVVHQIHGCVHPVVAPCSLPLKPQYSSWRRPVCYVCSGDKCNKNPAGKMSSSFYTITATVLGLILVKIYA